MKDLAGKNPFGALRPQKRKQSISEPDRISMDTAMYTPPQSVPPQTTDITVLDTKSQHIERLKDGSVLVGMQLGQRLSFHGRVLVRVIRGQLNVLGYQLTAGKKTFTPCYSPSSHSLLSMEAARPADENISLEVLHSLSEPVVIQLKSLSFDGLENLIIEQPLFKYFAPASSDKRSSLLPGFVPVNHEEENDLSMIQIPMEWHDIIACLNAYRSKPTNRPPIVVVIGGKNSGKSTFGRFLMNSLLNEYDEVAHLECDVGQCEFTPAGCVSLTTIKSPVIGPPFTHLTTPQHSHFIGLNSPEQNPAFYFSAVVSAFKHYVDACLTKNIPLIINTQGWLKGIGLELLLQILQFCRPSHLVQFSSPDLASAMPRASIDLFAEGLTSQIIDTWYPCNLKPLVLLQDLQNWNPETFLLPSVDMKTSSLPSKVSAMDHRNMALLSYFAKKQVHSLDMEIEDVLCWDFKPVTSLIPYAVPFHQVAAEVLHHQVSPEHLLRVLNSSLVGLTTFDDLKLPEKNADTGATPLFFQRTVYPHEQKLKTIGLGIVRAIDTSCYYIITAHDQNELITVNLISRGAIELPSCLLYQDDCIEYGPYAENYLMEHVAGLSMRKVRRNIQRERLMNGGMLK